LYKLRPKCRRRPTRNFKPQITNATTVTWKVLEGVQSVEPFYREIHHGVGAREANIYSDLASTVGFKVKAAIPNDTSARYAEMEF
jgi:hypothetical protein